MPSPLNVSERELAVLLALALPLEVALEVALALALAVALALAREACSEAGADEGCYTTDEGGGCRRVGRRPTIGPRRERWRLSRVDAASRAATAGLLSPPSASRAHHSCKPSSECAEIAPLGPVRLPGAWRRPRLQALPGGRRRGAGRGGPLRSGKEMEVRERQRTAELSQTGQMTLQTPQHDCQV